MAEVIIDFVGQSNMKPVEDSLNKIDGLLDEQKLKYNQINQDAAKVGSTMTATGKAAGKTAEEFDKLSKSAKETGKALADGVGKKVTDELVKAGKAADETSKQFKTAKAELRELQNQITSGKLSGEQLQQAQRRAAELKDNISDVSGAIKMMASDTRLFDLTVEGARGIAAAFSVAQGAAAVFGDKNQELEKAILKVQGAMAILTGVQEVANILTTKGGIATTVYGYALKGLEVIQKTFAVSSAAAWAIATAGITLVITGVVALIAYMSEFIGKSEDGIKKFEEYTKRIDAAFKGKQEAQERYIERLKAEGKTEAEINKASIAFAVENKKLIEKEIADLRLQEFRKNEIYKTDQKNLKLKNEIDKIQEEIRKKEKLLYETETERIALQNESLDIAKKEREEADKRAKEAEKRRKELEDFNKKELQHQIDIQKRLADRDKEAAASYEAANELLRQQVQLATDSNMTLMQLQEDYTNFVIENFGKQDTSFAAFEAKKRAELKKTADEAANQSKVNETLQKNRNLQLALQKDFNKSQQEIDEEYAEWLKNLKDGEKADFEEFEKFKRGEYKKTAELRKEQEKEITQFAFDSAKLAFDTIFEIDQMNRQARTEQEIASIQAQRDEEIARVEKQAQQGTITKEQEEAKKAAITKKYLEQERAAKARAWEAEKQAKLAQASINAALAITNVLATAPTPIAAAIQIAGVVAATAAQIAIIASTPPPQFAKGTKGGKKTPAGFKIVGEEGPELIYTPGGEKVITAPDTAKILDSYNIKTAKMPNMEKTKTDVSQVPIFDYGKLSQAVAGELSKQPRLQVNIDEKGFTKRLVEGRQRIEFLNNKFKFN